MSPKCIFAYNVKDLFKELACDLSGNLNDAVNEILSGRITKFRERTGEYQRFIHNKSYERIEQEINNMEPTEVK